MKKISLIFLTVLVVLSACKKSTDDAEPPSIGWSEEEKAFYDSVTSLQTRAGEHFDTWLLSMDSLEAILKLHQYFLTNPFVAGATMTSQGITIKYTNGLKGGIFLNGLDDPSGENMFTTSTIKSSRGSQEIKSLVNPHKAILINPHYWERYTYTDRIQHDYEVCLPETGFDLQNVLRNNEATVTTFTKLSGFGFIHIYSHGFAYPEASMIEDVFLLTGEQKNDATDNLYAEDIKHGNLITVLAKISGSEMKNVYFINKDFVASHNDFSKDTVLFYGGFCYGFLGKWPQLCNAFAKGAYFGFDWSVRTNYNSMWAQSLVSRLSNIQMHPPATIEQWMTDGTIEKSYYDQDFQKTVSILYTGDPSLAFRKETINANIVTYEVTDITSTTATGGGYVVSDGGSIITARGVCWDTMPYPTIAGNHTIDGEGTGVFVSKITGLSPSTYYWVRAYATNMYGTMYGEEYITFLTKPDPELIKYVSYNLRFGVHLKHFDKDGHLLSENDQTLYVSESMDFFVERQGNHVIATDPDYGVIDVTVNSNSTISLVLSYNHYDWEQGDSVQVDYSANDISFDGYDKETEWYKADELFQHMASFQGRIVHDGGNYDMVELIHNAEYDKGGIIYFGYHSK